MSEHGTISRYTNNRCRCDACRAAWNRYFEGRRERTRELANAYYHSHREEIRRAQNSNAKPRKDNSERWLRRAYGINQAERMAIFERQGGRCAICGTADATIWHIDHNHESGAIRSILCLNCNCGLGHFRDSPALLRKALAYLLAASA